MKRVPAILICAVMILALAAACTTTPPNNSPNAPSADFSQPPEEIKIVYYAGGGWVERENDQDVLDAINEEFAKKFNKTLSFEVLTTVADGPNQFQQAIIHLAAGAIDIFNIPGNFTQMSNIMFQPNSVKPLSDVVNQYGQNYLAICNEMQPGMLGKVTINGNLMCLPLPCPATAWVGAAIRKDLLDEIGEPIPNTFDEFESVLYKLRDAFPEIIPLDAAQLPWAFMNGMCGQFIPESQVTADGGVVPQVNSAMGIPCLPTTQEWKDWVKQMATWYKDGIWNPELFVWPQSQSEDMIKQGKTAAAFIHYNSLVDFSINGMEWVPLWDMTALYGRPLIYGYVTQPNRFFGVAYNASAKVTETIVQYLDWIASDEANAQLAWQGREGFEYNLVNGEIVKVQASPALYSSTWFLMCGFHEADITKKFSKEGNTLRETVYLPKLYDRANFPAVDIILQTMPFDTTKLTCNPTDLETMSNETVMKVIMGGLPPGDIDKLEERMDAIGLQEYNEARSEQYRALDTK